ncbi:hypothetical protein ABZ371_25955, partial [Streptomyces sp. NPDC005899]
MPGGGAGECGGTGEYGDSAGDSGDTAGGCRVTARAVPGWTPRGGEAADRAGRRRAPPQNRPRRSRARTLLPLGLAAWLVLEVWLLIV